MPRIRKQDVAPSGITQPRGGQDMKFVFEIDMNTDAVKLDPEAEIARALRYWAGNLKNYPMEQGAEEDVYDSAYERVGSWCIIDD